MGLGRCALTNSDECASEKRVNEALGKLSPAAMDAWVLFESSATQWRTDFGQLTGLDYGGVRAVAAALSLPWDEDALHYLGHLEGLRLKRAADAADTTGKPPPKGAR